MQALKLHQHPQLGAPGLIPVSEMYIRCTCTRHLHSLIYYVDSNILSYSGQYLSFLLPNLYQTFLDYFEVLDIRRHAIQYPYVR